MILVALLFVLLGVLIKYGKMYTLIAGYNTMSDEEKSNYNIEGIASLFFKTMTGMALVIALGYLISKSLNQSVFETASLFIALLTGIPYLLIKSNSNKYKTKK